MVTESPVVAHASLRAKASRAKAAALLAEVHELQGALAESTASAQVKNLQLAARNAERKAQSLREDAKSYKQSEQRLGSELSTERHALTGAVAREQTIVSRRAALKAEVQSALSKSAKLRSTAASEAAAAKIEKQKADALLDKSKVSISKDKLHMDGARQQLMQATSLRHHAQSLQQQSKTLQRQAKDDKRKSAQLKLEAAHEKAAAQAAAAEAAKLSTDVAKAQLKLKQSKKLEAAAQRELQVRVEAEHRSAARQREAQEEVRRLRQHLKHSEKRSAKLVERKTAEVKDLNKQLAVLAARAKGGQVLHQEA